LFQKRRQSWGYILAAKVQKSCILVSTDISMEQRGKSKEGRRRPMGDEARSRRVGGGRCATYVGAGARVQNPLD